MPSALACLARFALRPLRFSSRGQGLLVDFTFLGRLRFKEETRRIRILEGAELTVWPNDLIGRHLVLTGQFEHSVVEVLRRFARPGDQLLDLGANIGYVSCALLAAVPDLRALAVEPLTSCFALLEQNLRPFAQRARSERAAISDRPGQRAMRLHSTNIGASVLLPAPDAIGPDVERVQVITASELVSRHRLSRLDLVKLDVEGHEPQVIASLQPVLSPFRPRAIVFERYDGRLPPDDPIRTALESLGYRIFGIHQRLTGHDLVPVGRLDAGGRFHIHDFVALQPDAWPPV